jgi:hypothetical protein
MATTSIADLFTPDVWVHALRERQATFPSLFRSRAVMKSDLMDGLAAGPGIVAHVPFLKDITDQGDEIQVENTAPVNNNNQPGAVQLWPLLNRVSKNSVTALSAQVSGADPVAAIIDQLTMRRLKQRQSVMIAMLRGMMSTGTDVNASQAGALASMKYLNYAGVEPFSEAGAGVGADQLVSPDIFIYAGTQLGELENMLSDGAFLCHTNIKARLRVLDVNGFKTFVMPSELPFTIETYRDVPIFTSDQLARVGTQGGYVFDSYLMAPGTFGYGDKPQAADVADVASLSYFYDRDLNNQSIWDRTRCIMGIDGTKWVGAPAAQSATNAELQVAANWQLVYQQAKRCGVVAFRTNG